MLTYWTTQTSKTIVYVSRPLLESSLTAELEHGPVARHPQIAVMNNGFRQCHELNDIMPRYVALQAAGHITGWWGIAPNGFTTDSIASAITCAAGGLDVSRLWFVLDNLTWLVEGDEALDAVFEIFHPIDTRPPTFPRDLRATANSVAQITVTWTAATDNVGIVGYKVYRDGIQIATVTLPVFVDNGLSRATTYQYSVFAYDAAGNKSSHTATVSATTHRSEEVSLRAASLRVRSRR